jgi:glycosyltransferase involved in cell wall biosynthesis
MPTARDRRHAPGRAGRVADGSSSGARLKFAHGIEPIKPGSRRSSAPAEEGTGMRITWLLETADQLWGGVKVALEDANWLQRRGHQVTVVSRSGPPAWLRLDCAFRRVADFRPENLPDGDVVVGTFWTTVPFAAAAGPTKGVPVHFCQGYEGDNPEFAAHRARIEAVYQLPGVRHVTISPHLSRLLRERFGRAPHEVVYAIDHAVHFPGPERAPGSPLRVGLVGPYSVAWKDLPTGYAACRLLQKVGQPFVLVRASNTPPAPDEATSGLPIEWHQQLAPARMGDFYRSLDVLVCTSSGAEEGFFLPAIEAMACGVPTVLTDIPCFREHQPRVGHDRYALFVPPKDAQAMAEAIVVAGGLPSVRRTLRDGGIELAAHYHPDRHGQALEAAFAGFVRQVTPAAATAAVPSTAGDADADIEATLAQVSATLRELTATLARRGDVAGASTSASGTATAQPGPDAANPTAADTDLLLAAAQSQLALGEAAAALGLFDDLAARGSAAAAVQAGRGEALHALGRHAEAAAAFAQAMQLGDRSADAHNRLGVALYQCGDTDAARSNFERAVVLQPGHPDATANLTAIGGA